MTRKKWIVITLSVIVLIFLGLHLYYRSIQTDEWVKEDLAIQAAMKQTDLKKAEQVQKSVWADVYWIVTGPNAQNEELVVWVNQDGSQVHSELQSQGASQETIQDKVKSRTANADIVKMVPGTWEGQFVWQVFYKAADADDKERYYYDFYRFSDGGYLTTYTLPNR